MQSNEKKNEEVDYNKVLETGFLMGAAAVAALAQIDMSEEQIKKLYNVTIERYKQAKNVRA